MSSPAQKYGNWQGVADMLENAAEVLPAQLEKAVAKAAIKLASGIKKNITTGGSFAGKPFAALSPVTIQIKGSSKPLIDTSDMRNSVTQWKIAPFTRIVGIPGDITGGRKDNGERQKFIAEYARVHEFGGLTTNGRPIPARPFIGPTARKMRKELTGEEFQKMMKDLFKV